jgi:hypothetical protein
MPISAKELRVLVQTFPWDEWASQLQPGFEQIYRDLVVSTGEAIATRHGVSFDANDPFVSDHMTAYVGERIKQLSRTSRDVVIKTVRKALADGTGSAGELQTRILAAVRETYEDFEAYRALRIARTETAISFNHGSVLGAMQAGFDQVDVTDGTDDADCAQANGQAWSIEKALNNPIQHPNCSRVFTPHTDESQT